MSTSKRVISMKHKEEYLELIIKQKTAALHRCKQENLDFIYHNEEELLRITDRQSICKPQKFKAEDATPMADDDYLLAELNGHFE